MSSPHRAHAIHLVCTYMENKMAYEDSTGQDVNACSVNNSTLLSIYVDVDVCVCVCVHKSVGQLAHRTESVH